MSTEMISDQLLYWSDNEKTTRFCPTEKTSATAASTHAARQHSSWIPYRALQTLRKTRMSLCSRTRTWSQVLSVHQSDGQQAADGVCAPALLPTGGSIPRQPPQSPADSQGDFRHQPRTAETQRQVLSLSYVVPKPRMLRYQHRRSSYPGGQPARVVVGRAIYSYSFNGVAP